MKNNSDFFGRILKILEYKGIKNINEFALDWLNYNAPQKINRLKKKENKPSYDIILDIVNKFEEINPDWLLRGEGNMLKSEKSPNSHVTPHVITVNESNEDNVLLVPVQAQAGYLVGYNDPEFIEKLPTYSLPNIQNGIFRMFQVDGFSMYPTLQNQSYVVGQFVENWINDISDNRVYVVVTRDHGVIVKRVLNRLEKYGNLYCKSDNRREYPNIPIAKEDIQEVWECKMQLSFEFMDPADTYDKISNLEADVEMLKDLVQKQIGQKIRSIKGYDIAAEERSKYE